MLFTIQELYIIKTAPSTAFNALQENVREVSSISCILRFYWTVIHFYVYLSTCPHDAGVIWRRRFRSEKPSNVFDHNTHDEIENATTTTHDVIVFEKSVFKMFSVPTKTKTQRFQILPVWRVFSNKSSISWRISVDGRPNRRNKTAFWNIFLRRRAEGISFNFCKVKLNKLTDNPI